MPSSAVNVSGYELGRRAKGDAHQVDNGVAVARGDCGVANIKNQRNDGFEGGL